MNKRTILERINLLQEVFAYSLEHQRYLSDSKRICLSQERAAWLEVLESEKQKPKYEIPNHLELEVQRIAEIIKKTNWVKPEFQPF